MADTVGVSRSTVSWETIQASQAALQRLLERRFDAVDLLIIYLDGKHFGEQCVLAAVGVDTEGRKHVLALREGATENAEAAQDLLQQLVAQGVDPRRRRLFVIDGSKALRTAINAVFGAETPVQRSRNHKLRNVLGRLPRAPQAQTASLMRAAWKLKPDEGMAKFRQIAGWLEHDYPDAAASQLEGLEECFTINRAGYSALPALVLGHQQPGGQSALRSSQPDAESLSLASGDGGALVGRRVLGDGEVVPQNHGLSRPVGAQSDSRRIAARHPAGGGVE